MPNPVKHFYEFGPFRLNAEKLRLTRDGQVIPLSRKDVENLLVLVRNAGKPLEREELMQAVWGDTVVEDGNLTVAISHLRKALETNGDAAEYIETIPRVGYRFVAQVREVQEASAPLIIEKHTLSQTTIEEEVVDDEPGKKTETIVVRPSLRNLLPLALSRTASTWLLSLAALSVLALSAMILFKSSEHRGTITSSAPLVYVKSIAVLPPKALDSDAENASMSLGMADALITRLGSVRKLVVRPTSAVARYVGNNQDPVAAGRALNVDAVLDGSLQRDHGRMRVTLRLISVANGTQLWEGKFDEANADIFKLQDSVSQQVADALALNLSPGEKALLAKQQTTNPAAYDLYLKGNYLWSKRGAESAKILEYFRKAIELDPNFAPAYVGLATVNATSAIPSPEAEALIDKALQLDDSSAEAHATYAFIRMFHHFDWAMAERELDRAIELNPNSVRAHHWKGVYWSLRGRLDVAKAEMHRALDLDPQSLVITADIGQLHYFAHEYGQAIEYCNRTLAMDNSFRFAHDYLRDTYQMTGMDHQFFEEFTRTSSPADRAKAQHFFAGGGRKALLLPEVNDPNFGRFPGHMAWLSASLGDREKTLEYLNRVLQERGAGAFFLPYINVDPLYDFLRDDPRFKEILHKIGLS